MANFLFGQICLRGALFANAMLLLSICLLPGCSAYPEARYYKTADREYLYKEGLLPFSLQGALVTIAVTADNEAVETTKALEPYGLTRSKRREIKAVQDRLFVSRFSRYRTAFGIPARRLLLSSLR